MMQLNSRDDGLAAILSRRRGYSSFPPPSSHRNLDPQPVPVAALSQPRIVMDALPKLIARLQTWKLAAVAFLAGAASVLAMAPFFFWPVMFITFPLLIWTLDAVCFREAEAEEALTSLKLRFRRAAFIGWAFGFGYFLAGIYWVGYAFYVDAERYAILMPFAVAGLCAGLALFYAAAAALAGAMWQRGYARLLAFAFAFFCTEAARGYLFTGFPWNLFGEALAANDKLMQLAAYIGVYGLTLAALFVFAAPAAFMAAPEARFARRFSPAAISIILLCASYAFGNYRLSQEAGEVKGVRLRVVQPNIPQRERWKPENKDWIFDRVLTLTRSGTSGEDISGFTHVIWPESSVPFLFAINKEISAPGLRIPTELPHGTSLIMGAERVDGILSVETRYLLDRVYHNSLFVLESGAGIKAIYDKKHLVPFGEYVPFHEVLTMMGFRAFSHLLDGFEAGSGDTPLVETKLAPDFLPLICYEIIFPGRVNGKRPGWFVNVTNDAWFGDSTGPYQHLHQARIRATEEGIPVVRAANTGISAVIDPYGRVIAQLGLGRTGVIDHGLPRALSMTVYEKTRLPVFIILFLFPLQFYLIMVARVKAGWFLGCVFNRHYCQAIDSV
jgi:apolipoprotein N-acyltransferase